MLKNDMRKYIMQGKTFEQFIDDYGAQYSGEFSMDIMERCWNNTHELVDEDAWMRYLKNNAAKYVKYLSLVCEGLNDSGVRLNEIRAGYMLNDLIRSQIYDK